MASSEEAKLETFMQWLQANGVELRGCKIKWCDSKRGFGIFSDKDVSDGVMLVVPLDLAITPMRVLQDPLLGPACRAMFEEGDVDDRLLMMLLLTVERLRKNSLWKPYLDILPTTFGNPLWFSDDELQELRGTTLYRATELQKKSLLSLYESKVKDIVKKLLTLDGNSEIEVCFEDFLWANSVFWSRALNIPMPRSYVFPEMQDAHDICIREADEKRSHVKKSDNQTKEGTCNPMTGDTVWVEGLVPGIDFCNHDPKPIATWEVDGTGLASGVPFSMYLISAAQSPLQIDQEIYISYGNKGNEELLYLYGFVIDDNTDDYLMVHYPAEAINTISFSESKTQLLEVQKAEMRCLLPKTSLDNGFFPLNTQNSEENNKSKADKVCNYSWSGQRKMPSYVNKLVFPEKFMTTLRTIAMQEDEVFKVSSMLEELAGPERERQLSDTDVQSAVWEVCGDSGALQSLVDLLHVKMMDLEESSGTEENDLDLLKKTLIIDNHEDSKQCTSNLSTKSNDLEEPKLMTRNKWSAIVYRFGQKQLTRLFLEEAEHALQLSLGEEKVTSPC
ncbi:actin-histidine N-methyltransferase-like isoform X2 [Glycine soja]|uniref:[Fructose-bisphosphate aldolase]-lysine N-methyltransferase isoform A n=1 Tax=Glycine soja TaxID=3848 RepID=A0A445J6G9_GLYSO|nr:actin-histidine N-methyltransferase-like isoform X2 [Glycine soja]RZB93996.1 [Fructose-bisphosphate aldolase]-lysine N-methyltransferase isoform A [Glycine soja]